MSGYPGFTDRLARRWLKLYTAGLAESVADEQRAEIESDLAEHTRERGALAWSKSQIAKERLGRTLRGMPSDLLWRREALLAQQGKTAPIALVLGAVRWFRTGWHALVAFDLAVFYMLAVLRAHGYGVLGDAPFLRLMEPFGPDERVALIVGTVIIGGLIVTLLVGAVTRAFSLSVVGSNVAMIIGAVPAIAMWWMVIPGILFVLVVVGSTVDLTRQERALRPRHLESPHHES